jgi:DNA-binding MarR family transcriptional regulator
MTPPSIFPTVLRELLRTHQTFLSYAATHVHTLDLTLPQFDIILTLGNTAGMTFKKLGEETLITKGTLTGVISRLEDKGLVQRVASETDGRSQIVRLTAEGKALYERTFPEHLIFLSWIFNDYSPEDVAILEAALLRLSKAVITARSDGGRDIADETNGWCTKIKDVCKHHQDSTREST